MSVKLFQIMQAIEAVAPLHLQESYDNSGLVVGNAQSSVHAALLSLDCTEEVIQEAIDTGCNVVIAHHPIVFGGLKRFTGQNYVQRAIVKAIKHDIAIYACHTNLDNVLHQGVNQKIASRLDLQQLRILAPKSNLLYKLGVHVPLEHFEAVQQALFLAGAGNIGNYKDCGFSFEGQGTFLPSDGANPHTGAVGQLTQTTERRLEVILPVAAANQVLQAMKSAHPYEEVAYDLVLLNNTVNQYGSGVVGHLTQPMPSDEFLAFVKQRLELPQIRYTQGKSLIQSVAICGGSGAFLIHQARQQADAYITADVKYHEFFDAENQLMICDIGHFESEKYTIELFAEILSKKIPNFATIFAKTNTNPIHYYL